MTMLPPSASMEVPDNFDPTRDASILHEALKKKRSEKEHHNKRSESKSKRSASKGRKGDAETNGKTAEDSATPELGNTQKSDENSINDILGHRTFGMRYQIRQAYAQAYGEDIVPALAKEYKGDYEDIVLDLFRGPIVAMAKDLQKKIDAHNVDEIICCANNWELVELQKAYEVIVQRSDDKKIKHKTLLEAVSDKLKGPQKDYIVALLSGSREEVPYEDVAKAMENSTDLESLVQAEIVTSDVSTLLTAGEPKSGKPNEDVFVSILSKRSNIHLRCLYTAFLKEHNVSLVDFINKNIKSPLKTSLNTSIMAAVDYRLLLVAQLHDCMSGLGTREVTLNRIVGLRAELDLKLIDRLYEERIGKRLSDAVGSETSGAYKQLLLTLINDPLNKK